MSQEKTTTLPVVIILRACESRLRFMQLHGEANAALSG